MSPYGAVFKNGTEVGMVFHRENRRSEHTVSCLPFHNSINPKLNRKCI